MDHHRGLQMKMRLCFAIVALLVTAGCWPSGGSSWQIGVNKNRMTDEEAQWAILESTDGKAKFQMYCSKKRAEALYSISVAPDSFGMPDLQRFDFRVGTKPPISQQWITGDILAYPKASDSIQELIGYIGAERNLLIRLGTKANAMLDLQFDVRDLADVVTKQKILCGL
jgi:hypothetical protein